MRSHGDPDATQSTEHAMLDMTEAGPMQDERGLRLNLLKESERNIREAQFPELHARRSRNMQLLFELLRRSRVPTDSDFWLEARLLRLLERHDQCRQLCQTIPMYEWTFDVLQEFVWAGRGDSFPYPRRTPFENPQDAELASQLFAAAKTLYESKCYQWQQAHDAAAALEPEEARASKRTDIGLVITLIAAALSWYFWGWWAAFAAFVIGSSLLFGVFDDSKDLVRARMKRWCQANPKPGAMSLTLEHLPPPTVHMSYDWSA
jgi:hypothetical protein